MYSIVIMVHCYMGCRVVCLSSILPTYNYSDLNPQDLRVARVSRFYGTFRIEPLSASRPGETL